MVLTGRKYERQRVRSAEPPGRRRYRRALLGLARLRPCAVDFSVSAHASGRDRDVIGSAQSSASWIKWSGRPAMLSATCDRHAAIASAGALVAPTTTCPWATTSRWMTRRVRADPRESGTKMITRIDRVLLANSGRC